MTNVGDVDPNMALVPLQKNRTTDDCEMVVCVACLTNSGFVVNGSNSAMSVRRRRGTFLHGKDIYMLVDFQDILCGFLYPQIGSCGNC